MKLQERGTLLIPIDFTEQSLLAIKQAYNLAKYTHSKIVLLHSYEKVGEEKYDEFADYFKKEKSVNSFKIAKSIINNFYKSF